MYFVEITDNSTYDDDLSFAISNINLYNTLSGDDTKITVNLTNSFIYNNVPYNIIYINSNGTIGFNAESYINGTLPSYDTASNMSAFFLPWVDTNEPNQIYYREDINLKTFTLIYDRKYYSSTAPYKVGIKLFLDGSGKAIINFGETANISNISVLGFSFASNTRSTFITNSLTGNFTPLQSPLVNITNNQSFYTNKQIIITTAIQVTPTITNFSIPTKTFGNTPFQITQPTSNSSGTFSYTSSNLSVATISGNIITIVGAGTSEITALQSATTDYTSGSTTATFQVNQSTPINPVIITNGDELLYFMNTSSSYANITNSLEIDENLVALSYKVLTGNNVKITKSNN